MADGTPIRFSTTRTALLPTEESRIDYWADDLCAARGTVMIRDNLRKNVESSLKFGARQILAGPAGNRLAGVCRATRLHGQRALQDDPPDWGPAEDSGPIVYMRARKVPGIRRQRESNRHSPAALA